MSTLLEIAKLSQLILQQKENVRKTSLLKVMNRILKEHPKPKYVSDQILEIVRQFDVQKLDMNGVLLGLDKIDVKTTTLPATAQVASQQGAYLGKVFNQLGKVPVDDWTKKSIQPFRYRHLGNFAYVGDKAAVLELGHGQNVGGFGGFLLWRSAYLSKQVSLRTRVLLAIDWTKTIVFGRDISKI
jgi:NADH:ubiquinone reductase (H+-translocating)